MLFESFPKTWSSLLQEEARKDYLFSLEKKIEEAYASSICFPPKQKIFEAFALCKPKDVRVVILGQDPYHGTRFGFQRSSRNKNAAIPSKHIQRVGK